MTHVSFETLNSLPQTSNIKIPANDENLVSDDDDDDDDDDDEVEVKKGVTTRTQFNLSPSKLTKIEDYI